MNYVKRISIMFICLAICAGCKTLNAPPVSYETWTPRLIEDPSKTTDYVWTSIREQKIDTSKPLTLMELAALALQNSPSTRKAWEEARSKEYKKKQTESAYYPGAVVSAAVNKQKISGSLKVNDINELNYTPNVTLRYLLLDFGGRSAKVDEAYQTLIYSNFQFNQSIQDILLDVATKYFELYSARSLIDSAMSDLLDTKTALNAAVQKFEVGLVTKLDVLQAKSSFDKSLYYFEDAKGRLKTAQSNIANTVGLPADTKIDIVEPTNDISKDVIRKINKKKVSDIIEESLKKRPDVSAGRASLAAKEAAVKSANSDLWPTLNAQGSAQKDWYDYYNSVANKLSNKDDYQYNIYLSVNWNVFDGFYNLNRKREAQAIRDKEREILRQTELSASADVWTTYYNFRTAVQKLIASKAYLNSSKTSYDLALQGYDAGLKNILDLLKAQNDLSSARTNLIQSRRDLFVALASFAHSTGSLNTQQMPEEIEKLTKNSFEH